MPLHLVLLGAKGYVGSAIVELARRLGPDVLCLHALARGHAFAPAPGVTFFDGRLDALPAALLPGEPYVVAHFATKQIDRDGSGFDENNVEGTRAVLRALGPLGGSGLCRGVLYGSSASVYGQGAQDGLDEAAPVRPGTPLARSRAEAEALVLEGAARLGIAAFGLRPRFVLGPGDRFVLPGIASVTRRRFAIGSGRQRFSVIDVDDYAALVVDLARTILEGGRPATQAPLNVGYAEPLSFDEIQAAIRGRFALPPHRLRVPVSPGLLRALGVIPSRAVRALATKLELVGVSHYARVDRLAALVGSAITGKAPALALARAVQAL